MRHVQYNQHVLQCWLTHVTDTSEESLIRWVLGGSRGTHGVSTLSWEGNVFGRVCAPSVQWLGGGGEGALDDEPPDHLLLLFNDQAAHGPGEGGEVLDHKPLLAPGMTRCGRTTRGKTGEEWWPLLPYPRHWLGLVYQQIWNKDCLEMLMWGSIFPIQFP